jgi:delta1-piperideine-2-carboxylate reductase
VLISFGELTALLRDVFVAAGVASGPAEILAANCAMCERDGAHSHGIFRIPGYLASLKSGWADGHAVPILEEAGPAFLRVDAANGFAQPALAAAMPRFLQMVRDNGVAVLAMRDSHHFSALWPDIEPFANAGFIAITTVVGRACVAPFGSTTPLFGTNPIAFAAPVAGGDPLIFDQATSAISNGDLRLAARDGRTLAGNVGIDKQGQASTDPQAVLDGGALLPFGGYKGAALSLMVEILAGALTGGQFSHQVDYSAHPGAHTAKTGQLVIVIDPARGLSGAAARTHDLIEILRASGADRLPGDRRNAARRKSGDGIAIDPARLDELKAWAN